MIVNIISPCRIFMISLLSITLLLRVFPVLAEQGRFEQELYGEKWKLWLDREAEWDHPFY